MLVRGHFERVDEVLGQLFGLLGGHAGVDQAAIQAEGVVFHHVAAGAAVVLPLVALVAPAEGRLDAVAGVVGKGQTDGAGGRDRQQVAVADAVLADVGLDVGRQAAGEGAFGQIAVDVEPGERALFLGQLDRGAVGRVAHAAADLGRHLAPVLAVVAQLEHGQRIAQAGEADADAALGGAFGALLLQWPEGDVEHVVQRTHLNGHDLLEGVEVEARLAAGAERVAHEVGQDDGTQVAAAIGRQRLFATGVSGLDLLGVVEVVVAPDLVEEQDARLGKVVGRGHDGVPQLARRHLAVHPLAVGALVGTLGLDLLARFGLVHQLPIGARGDRLHEGVGHADRDVEVVPAPRRALGGDEFQHVRVVDAQHAHLRAAPAAGALDRRARLVEHVHVAARPAGKRMRALDEGALGADAAEVVAHATAAAHGLGGLAQGFVDARVAVGVAALNGVAHRLHEAVDQRGLNIGAGRAHDAPGADGAGVQVGEEFLFPLGAQFGLFDAGQRARHAAVELVEPGLARLEVLFGQHITADGLRGQGVLRARQGISFHALNSSDRQGRLGRARQGIRHFCITRPHHPGQDCATYATVVAKHYECNSCSR